MSERFQAGDRVRPREGGRIMSVKGYEDGQVVCSWYKPRDGWQELRYAEEALRRVGRPRVMAER